MKKKNKKLFVIVHAILIVVIGGIILGISLNTNRKELTLSEKKWVEENKNSMIDIYIMNNLPIFSDENGIFLSFLDYFEAETGLSLNRVSYSISNPPTSNYLFRIVDEKDDIGRNDLLFYKDNYVIVSKQNKAIYDFSSLEDYKIGVLSSNLTSITEYMAMGNSLTFTNYEDDNALFEAFSKDEVNYIIVPKNRYLKEIVSNDYYIVKILSNLSDKYTLSLNINSNKLNDIFTKVYSKWYKNNFSRMYSKNINEYYYKIKNIDEKTKSSFLGKKYIYGYVENIPYDISNDKGLNYEFLSGFEKFSGVLIQYKKYNSLKALKDAYDKGNVDIMFNYYDLDSSTSNQTINVYKSTYVILSNINNNIVIDSFASLKDVELYALKDTTLTNYINNNTKATIKTFNNVNNLVKNKAGLVLLDINTYNFYKNTKLKDYYIVYDGTVNLNYNYLIKRDNVNNTFTDAFNYYLLNVNSTEVKNNGLSKLSSINIFEGISITYYVIVVAILVIVYAMYRKSKDKKVKVNEEKSKFIDPLTSLKNRNYLNYNLDKWDNNKVYPQSIIIVDLNDLKEINNELGYQEGDEVIKAAANILINNQLKNTDIIRTDGNEFMIYMVGYNEDQVVLYMRKLYKLMKDLPHEKGATLGYSMILDDIKLIEDAVNDAILEIKENKSSKEKDK